jgi:hypothetical protein
LSDFKKAMIGTMNMRPVSLTSRSMADVLLQGTATRMMAWMAAEPEKVIAEAAAPAASQMDL